MLSVMILMKLESIANGYYLQFLNLFFNSHLMCVGKNAMHLQSFY